MRRALLPIVLLIASAVAVLRDPPPSPPVLDEGTLPRSMPALAPADAPSSIDELCKRVALVLERDGVPGVAIALVGRDGPIWIGGVGVADTETRTPVGADTVFRVASITKSIVGIGVMRLVEQNRLDLDRPLRDMLPEVVIDNAWDDIAPVTIAHTLEHTAGIDDMRFNEVFTDDDAMTPATALAINPRSRTVRWRPGSRMSYSNVGYSLAGRAIEVATGEPFDAWLTREVVRPLGMRDADFRRTDVLAARLATGYIERDRAAQFSPIAHRPAGALLASATDLAKLVQFWLRRGEGTSIVSPAGLDRIERAGTLPFPHIDLEYGLGNYGDVSHPILGRGHDGGLPGFASSMRYFTELGKGYVVLLNGTYSARAYVDIRRLVFAYLVRERTLSSEPIAAPSTGPGADFYAFASPRNALFGFVERTVFGWQAVETPGGVRLEPLIGDSHDLVSTKDGYKLPGESGTSLQFTQSRDGTPVMVGHFIYAEAGSWWPARIRLTAMMVALWLLQIAPLWTAITLIIAAFQRRRPAAFGLVMWPAIAGVCFIAAPILFVEAARSQVLGVVHPLTVAVFATTIVFAIASIAGLASAVRWSLRPDRPSLWSRLVPTATAIAAFGLMLWLGANGIIGLRTWAW